MEQIDARLASMGLLAVAKHGEDPESCKSIVDLDLSMLPALAPTHRDYYRNMETRMKWTQVNASNEEKRKTLRLEAWTKVYTLLKVSTETSAPVLSRLMLDECDIVNESVVGLRLADMGVLFEGINAKATKEETFNHIKTLNRHEWIGLMTQLATGRGLAEGVREDCRFPRLLALKTASGRASWRPRQAKTASARSS